MRDKELPEDFRYTDGLPIFISLFMLLFFLAVRGSSVLISGLWAVISFFVIQLLLNMYHDRFSWSVLGKFFQSTVDGIRSGAIIVVQITCMLGTVSIVAKMLIVTGLSQDLSFLMIDLSGENLLILLPLVFVVSILFGMAMTTAVVYIVVVILAAPALQMYGIEPHVAHFTVFYMAMLSALTPPVALAVAVACNISKAPFWSTAWTSMRIGLPLFLLPFVFLFKPDVLAADLVATPIAGLQILIGFLAIAYALNGKRKGIIGYIVRFIFFVLGAVAIFSSESLVVWPGLIAILVLGAVLYFSGRQHRAIADIGLKSG